MDVWDHGQGQPPTWQGDCDDESCQNNNQEGKCEVEVCQYVPM